MDLTVHVTAEATWVSRIVKAALVVGGPWCLLAVAAFQSLLVGLIWRAVRR